VFNTLMQKTKTGLKMSGFVGPEGLEPSTRWLRVRRLIY